MITPPRDTHVRFRKQLLTTGFRYESAPNQADRDAGVSFSSRRGFS